MEDTAGLLAIAACFVVAIFAKMSRGKRKMVRISAERLEAYEREHVASQQLLAAIARDQKRKASA